MVPNFVTLIPPDWVPKEGDWVECEWYDRAVIIFSSIGVIRDDGEKLYVDHGPKSNAGWGDKVRLLLNYDPDKVVE